MSGARNCPETPRQKMIGMMYLVLTAMLALNVSSEILHGFTLVDNSLHTSIKSAETRRAMLYDDFAYLEQQNPDKVKEWLDLALVVKTKSDSLYNYLQDFKYQIVLLADGKKADPEARKIMAKDNLDKAGEYALIGGHGKTLKKKISEFRELMVGLSDNVRKQELYNELFYTDDLNGIPWENGMFEMMPVSAVVTVLTKYQNDVRAAENEMIQYLKSQTDASDFRVNKIEALVVPNSKYIMRGGRYSAQIVLSAIDSTKTPEIFVGGNKISNGIYEVSGGSTGSFTYSGEIRLATNDGGTKSFPFKGDYMVGEPSATISNEDLNVVYRGIDNRFSISVPGVAADDVSVRVTGGTATKSRAGRYIIRTSGDGEISIAVFGKVDGREMPMGSSNYRIKDLPRPDAFFAFEEGGTNVQRREGNISRHALTNTGSYIIASYGQDELVSANFEIVSFSIQTKTGFNQTNGSRLTEAMKRDIMNLAAKDWVIFGNIRAKGPDGRVRTLNPITFQL